MKHSIVAALVLFLAGTTLAGPPADTLLPADTKAFLSVPDVDALSDGFHRSPLGQLIDDPNMQPFVEDLKQQFQQKNKGLKDRIGITVEDLEGLASGELALGLCKAADGQANFVAIVEVAKNLAAAQEAIATVEQFLTTQRGARRSPHQIGGVALSHFEVPGENGAPSHHAIYFLLNDQQLVVVDDLELATQILKFAAKERRDSLATLPAYAATMKRCETSVNVPHQAKFFIDPIGVGDCLRASSTKQLKGTDYFKIAKKEGFDAVKGIGGHLNFSADQYGLLYRVSVYAPQPWQRAMRMLKFPNTDDFEPEEFVSNTIASYLTMHIDPLNAFDNFGTLFDTLFGEGDEIWPDVIDSLKNDPDGPKIDLRGDIVAHLKPRATIMIDNKKPIDVHSQRRLIAVKAKNPPALAAAIERLMKNDESAKVHAINGTKIYEIIPDEGSVAPLEINAGVNQQKVPAPHQGVGVANGYLFVSSHFEQIMEIVKTPQAATPLAADNEYQFLRGEIGKLVGQDGNAPPAAAESFYPNEERFLVAYELLRQNKLMDASNLAGKLLNALLTDPTSKTPAVQELDGSKLPPFESIKKYASTGGGTAISEDNGWFLIGFTLDKNRQGNAAAQQPNGLRGRIR